MLNGRPAVFLSCSEKFKATVAFPIRESLDHHGIHGVIVSEEPLLPRVGWAPDDKVDSYLNASSSLVALCTPDDQLSDGTVQCRQNVIDEIERARHKPHLRDRIMVLRALSVRLPSNINPTYEYLDADQLDKTLDRILLQLQTWGVLPMADASAPLTLSAPPISVDTLVDGIELGDHDKASQRAYQLALETTHSTQRQVVTDLHHHLRKETDDTQIHIGATVLEGIARIDETLVPIDVIEELANSEETAKRIAAISLLWDLADAAPGFVPLGIVGRLARPADEDWYVEAPAMAVTKLLMLHRRNARLILDRLADSDDVTDRYEVAVALLDLASVDGSAVPPDLAAHLARDSDELVARKGEELIAAISHVDERAYEKRFSPFGI
jgi:hypothetical protein